MSETRMDADYLRLEYKAKFGEMPKAVPDPRYAAFADDDYSEPIKRLYVGRNVKVRIANSTFSCLSLSILANMEAQTPQNCLCRFPSSPTGTTVGFSFSNISRSLRWSLQRRLGRGRRVAAA